MSTSFIVHREGNREVMITESSSLFDLDLFQFPAGGGHAEGPQEMSADEALHMATGFLYAVWCSYPEKTQAWVESMDLAGLPAMWSRVQAIREEA